MQEILNRVQEQLNENWAVDKEDIQALVDYVENDEWISVDDRMPEKEEREYAVTDGHGLYISYYGFNHKTKKTKFQSTHDDFDSLFGCGEIKKWKDIE